MIIKHLKNKFKKSFLKIRFIVLFILIFAEVKTNKNIYNMKTQDRNLAIFLVVITIAIIVVRTLTIPLYK